jgi:hypothetical protein
MKVPGNVGKVGAGQGPTWFLQEVRGFRADLMARVTSHAVSVNKLI